MSNPPKERTDAQGKPLCNRAVAGRLCLKTAMPGTTRCYIHGPKDMNDTVRQVREAIHISRHHE